MIPIFPIIPIFPMSFLIIPIFPIIQRIPIWALKSKTNILIEIIGIIGMFIGEIGIIRKITRKMVHLSKFTRDPIIVFANNNLKKKTIIVSGNKKFGILVWPDMNDCHDKNLASCKSIL